MTDMMRQTGATLADRLKIFKPHLPDDIIPSSHLDIMERICSFLPDPITNSLGFELHLSKPRPRFDYVLGVKSRQGRPWLARAAREENLPESWRNTPAWQGIRAYARCWSDPGDPLYQKGGPLWMAFDLTDPTSSLLPVPGVYISPVFIPLTASATIPEKLFSDFVRKSLQLLSGPDFNEDIWEKVLHCYRCLPPGANIFQVGRMFSRKGSGLKVCVIGVPADQIITYLEKAGWTGPFDRIREAIEWACGLTDFLCFSFSVHPHGTGSDLGIECHYHNRRQPFQEPRWHTFLEGLVSQGLCSAEKKEALLRWPRIYRPPPDKGIQCLRRLSWIKLKWKNDSLEAKAYLGFAIIRRKPAGG